MNKKLITAASIALAACVAIGGTIAYLTATSGPIENTFTVGKVDVTLTEEAGGKDHEFSVTPGQPVAKDPKVSVSENSESAYVFVKIEKGQDFDKYFDIEVDDAWTELEDGVYYAETTKGAAFTESVLENDQVLPNWTELKGDSDLTNATLTFTAYAIQKDGLTDADEDGSVVDDAWAIVSTAQN